MLQFPPEERTAFFKKAKTCTDATGQKELYHSYLQERVFELGGVFRPMSIWQTLGYDGRLVAIRSLPEDVRSDRIFGLVYRVPKLYVGHHGSEGTNSSATATTQ